ncbi:MAG TPA: penicillin acylase family protein [Gemmataceae bacterium]|nr:penicillin acylase family protein [Gemmataceae bacterium]
MTCHSIRAATLAVILLSLALSLPGASEPALEEVTIYRDEFGIPNIFAATEEGVCFGMGYAQAEDRLEEIFKQYRRAEGTMAEAFGPEYVSHDYRQRLWQHRAIAAANYPKLPPKVRSTIEAFQAGIKQYMKEHPEKVPAWAPELHPWQVVALGRFIIWGWPEGDAAADLRAAGIEPDPPSLTPTPLPPGGERGAFLSPSPPAGGEGGGRGESRGSNQWVIAADRTADGYPLALIDPHLSWYGPFRFYEARLYGGELQTAGMTIPGVPLRALGHNRYCSVAMTTGGPDAADVYEEELNPANPRQYRYDGQWRDMTVRTEVIKVKEGDQVRERRFEIEYTHHGPVVARRDGKAYAMKLPYFDQFRLPEQIYLMNTARNLQDMKKALALFQVMEQNIMVATVDGDLFYLRNGRVPIRPKGFDFSRPVPGNTSKSEWLGIHPIEDLVQLHNPWQGYMQNCNVAPQHMMKFCPLTPERYAERPYLHNGRRDNPLHQRAAMILEELHAATRVTVADAIALALSTQVYHADLWQARLAAAGKEARLSDDAARLYDRIIRWNRRADADSTGAVAYWYWKRQLGEAVLRADRAGQPPPANLTDEQLVRALEAGAEQLRKDWGRLEVKWGEVFRVGREGGRQTWPVGGGSVPGMATPRAIGFQPQPDGKTWIGRSGQTSVQVVQLSKPPRSWTLLPLGQSDDPASKHFDDQAQKLFSPGKMKPTYFLNKEGLLQHVESKKVLSWPPRP